MTASTVDITLEKSPLEPPTIPVAVRALVSFVLGGGDLGFEFAGSRRALEGIRLHQQLQRRRPAEYRAEVPVAKTVAADGAILRVSGRMDGVFEAPDHTIVEEIKTTTRDIDDLDPAAIPEHWGQARVYAYLYADEKALAQTDVQLTYIQVDTGEIRTFRETWTAAALERVFTDLVDRYARWARRMGAWSHLRDASIRELAFPFTRFRPGQRPVAVAVYRAIAEGRQSMIQAATGIGKTMGVLFAAIKALLEQPPTALVYLTARTTGQRAARDALVRLSEGGLRFKTVLLTAKDKICFLPESACQAATCPFAAGYFDRLAGGREVFFDHDIIDREVIEAAARTNALCPFALSLELAALADGIVCDYNYAFDPRVSLKGVVSEEQRQVVLLVDEAHNLVDRAREMFSADLSKKTLLDVRRPLKTAQPVIYRHMGRINAWLLDARKRLAPGAEGTARSEPPEDLYPLLRRFCTASEKWLAASAGNPEAEALLTFFFKALGFLRVADQYGADYVTCYSAEGQDLVVKLFCLDPSRQLAQVMSRCRSVVLFSATLSPGEYFRRLLGLRAQSVMIALPSPFPPDHLAAVRVRHVSTLYRDRPATEGALCEVLGAVLAARRGNYLFFFPSYAYMARVYERFAAAAPEGFHLCIQESEMSEAARHAFIARFDAAEETPTVGFAVMGGIFGEGIDLVGRRLSGAVIVGVGLPGVSLEQELIRAYFQAREGRGFAFAYQYPGINRVLQAAGRVIRSESDRGIVVLVDRRYGTAAYADLLPAAWKTVSVGGAPALLKTLAGFWDGKNAS
ncbi:MAG: helicase C-terminal domain-containing protein [Pseudomonadota bacterium]